MIINNINVEKLDDFGRGIAYFNNKIVFINNALFNEIVDIEVIKETNKYYEANVSNYVHKNQKRRKTICPYYDKCGGCNLMHLNYEEQLKYKKEKVSNVLNRICKIDTNKIKDIIFDKEYNYRNKIVLKVDKDIGLYEKNSNVIVPIDYCYLVNDRINELIKIIDEKINYSNISEIMIRVVADEIIIVFYGKNFDKSDLLQLKEYVSSIYIYDNSYSCIYGKERVKQTLKNISLFTSPDSFLQVNNKVCIKMYEKISNYIKNKPNLLDLYCGVGSIGLYVSEKCKEVIGVEVNKYAIKDAIKNKELNKIKNISFYNMKANEIFKKIRNVDFLIVDPPRSGMDKETLNIINESKIKDIIYVSCDLMTLARDLNLMSNYIVEEVTPIDMFPNTYHVENVVKLIKKGDK